MVGQEEEERKEKDFNRKGGGGRDRAYGGPCFRQGLCSQNLGYTM